jgi:hypothetical protein
MYFSTFSAGDLAPGDTIFLDQGQHGRGERPTGLLACRSPREAPLPPSEARPPRDPWRRPVSRGSIEIRTDTFVVCEFVICDKLFHSLTPVASIAANGLKVNVEYWVSSASKPIDVRIVAAKPGMKHLPLE